MITSYSRFWASVLLLSGLTGCSRQAGPEEVVKQFHTLATKGDWDAAVALVDLGAKSARMLGEVYTSGSAEEQGRTRRLFRERLVADTALIIDRHFRYRAGEFSTDLQTRDLAEVTQKSGLHHLSRKGKVC